MKVNPELIIERVGDEIVVLDSKTSSVWSVSADAARVIRSVLDGEKVSPADDTVASLFERGILVSAERPRVSRRSLVLGSGAAGLGATLALSMPAAANASSPVEETAITTDPPAPPAPEVDSQIEGIFFSTQRTPRRQLFLSFPLSAIVGYQSSDSYILLIEDLDGLKEFPLTEVGSDLVFDETSSPSTKELNFENQTADIEGQLVRIDSDGVRSQGATIVLVYDD